MDMPKQEPSSSWTVVPTPGYVVKFKEVVMDGLDGAEKRKCFLNICHSPELPPPMDDIDEDELAKRIDAGDYSFKIPISIGELDCVKDKHDDNTVKIDILVNSVFYDKRLSKASDLFYRHFLCMVVCEAIEKKYKMELSPIKSIVLVNRKKMGDIEPMLINKRPPAPVILEVEKEEKHVDQQVLAEQTPLSCLKQVDGVSIKLFKGQRLEILLDLSKVQPSVNSPKRLRLRVNEDRVILLLDNSRSLYDFCIPFLVDAKSCRSKLLLDKNSLAVTLDVTFP